MRSDALQMRFSANLSFLFKDASSRSAFREPAMPVSEFTWPGTGMLPAVRQATDQTGLKVALFNFDAGRG